MAKTSGSSAPPRALLRSELPDSSEALSRLLASSDAASASKMRRSLPSSWTATSLNDPRKSTHPRRRTSRPCTTKDISHHMEAISYILHNLQCRCRTMDLGLTLTASRWANARHCPVPKLWDHMQRLQNVLVGSWIMTGLRVRREVSSALDSCHLSPTRANIPPSTSRFSEVTTTTTSHRPNGVRTWGSKLVASRPSMGKPPSAFFFVSL
jgi:hypothetical protein